MVRHEEIKILEYNHIIDGIFIGTNKCCRQHFSLLLLDKEDIQVDISLEGEKADDPYGVKYYIWLPVLNFKAPLPEQFKFGVKSLEEFVGMKKKIYVHCQNGHGRAPTLVAAYLIKKYNKTVSEAIEIIKKARPSIHLEEIQIQSLEIYKDSLK